MQIIPFNPLYPLHCTPPPIYTSKYIHSSRYNGMSTCYNVIDHGAIANFYELWKLQLCSISIMLVE